MPRFDFDPNAVAAAFTVVSKGRYEFLIGKPKAFSSVDKTTGLVKNYGVRAAMTCKTAPYADKTVQPFTCYMHSEGAQKFTKGMIMAAFGFQVNPTGEHNFNAEYATRDWSFNTPDGEGDEGSVGEIWQLLEGKRVMIECDTDIDPDTKNERQQFKGFFPLGV